MAVAEEEQDARRGWCGHGKFGGQPIRTAAMSRRLQSAMSNYAIRTATLDDLQALTDIYNYYVINTGDHVRLAAIHRRRTAAVVRSITRPPVRTGWLVATDRGRRLR